MLIHSGSTQYDGVFGHVIGTCVRFRPAHDQVDVALELITDIVFPVATQYL